MDPKDLNSVIKRQYFQIPTIEAITHKLSGAQYFSTLDATSSFHQILLDEKSTNLCAFGIPYGRYKFLRLPYGIKSASEVFQERFKEIFNFEQHKYYKGNNQQIPLSDGCKIYVQVTPKLPWHKGIIVKNLGYRAYTVKADNGTVLTRNRKFIKVKKEESQDDCSFQNKNRTCNENININKENLKRYLELKNDTSEVRLWWNLYLLREISQTSTETGTTVILK